MRQLILFICLHMALSLPLQSQEPKHLQIARSFVGITEDSPNRGYWIDRWNRNAKVSLGSPYCASMLTFCLDSANVKEPTVRSALARNFITKKSIPAAKVLRGEVTLPSGTIAVWRSGNTIYGHVGITTKPWTGPNGSTIEANTSPSNRGSQRDGEGVYDKNRSIVPGAAFRITDFTLVKYE